MRMNNLSSSIISITGGTGSFGSTMARRLLLQDVAEIRIFSRDETKQDQLRNEIRDERLKFIIGDVRDYKSVESAIEGSNYVFHAAALKQVPSCEFFPMQAVATNIEGSSNVIEASIKSKVSTVVCLSTDKAVYPINAMGLSKALMEKVAQSYSRKDSNRETKIAITRYGNVMMSRGSVIPLFINQIRRGEPVTITDPTMTRFLMSLDDSVDLVNFAFTNAQSGDLFIKKAPGCSVETLIKGIALLEGQSRSLKIKNIGVRHGEKHAEALLSVEERAKCIDLGDFFRVPIDSRSLDYQIYFEKGQSNNPGLLDAYTSSNTEQLDSVQVAEMIGNLPEYKKMSNK